jgi:hypothetical protein
MATTNKAFRVKSGLTVEGGQLSPAAGTTTYPPILLTSGTNLTSAVAGGMEFDGTRLYFSPSTTRKTIAFTDDVPTSLSNSISIKFDSGTTEGTDLYTFNGSAPKTFSINGGTNITITKTANTLSIASTDTNYYPTAVTMTAGTTAGPTVDLTMTGTSNITGSAIPSAGASASGIVTTGAQTFGGVKTFASPVITTSIDTTSTTVNVVNANATTVNFANAATTISIGATTGTTTFNGNVTITNNLTVEGTVTTINSTTITVDDKNLVLGNVASSSNTTANGGGITIEATTGGDKTFNWVSATQGWTSSENMDLAAGKVYKIGTTDVLSNTTIGSTVVNSSLTKVGLASAGFVKSDSSGNLTVDTATYLTAANVALTGTATLNSVAQWVTATGTGATNTAPYTSATLFNTSSYTGGEFIVKADNATDREIIKVLVVTKGTDFYVTQYGDVQTNGSLMSIDFSISTGNVAMVVTPTNATATSIKITGTLLAV